MATTKLRTRTAHTSRTRTATTSRRRRGFTSRAKFQRGASLARFPESWRLRANPICLRLKCRPKGGFSFADLVTQFAGATSRRPCANVPAGRRRREPSVRFGPLGSRRRNAQGAAAFVALINATPQCASAAGSAVELMKASCFSSFEPVNGLRPPAAARHRASRDARLSTGFGAPLTGSKLRKFMLSCGRRLGV